MRDKDIFRRQNEEWRNLLITLWKEVWSRDKIEWLWKQEFRERLDYWEVPYHEDIIRLEVPLIIPADDDEEDEEDEEPPLSNSKKQQ